MKLALIGRSPLAEALLGRLPEGAQLWVVSATPYIGPWLWRQGDPNTGEALREALADATHVICHAQGASDGLHLWASVDAGARHGLWISAHGESPPKGLPHHWSRLSTGMLWSSRLPPVQRWKAAGQHAEPLTVWKGQPIASTPVSLAAARALAAVQQTNVEDTLPTASLTPAELAQLAVPNAPQQVRPWFWARRQLGLDPGDDQRWSGTRSGEPVDGDWQPDDWIG